MTRIRERTNPSVPQADRFPELLTRRAIDQYEASRAHAAAVEAEWRRLCDELDKDDPALSAWAWWSDCAAEERAHAEAALIRAIERWGGDIEGLYTHRLEKCHLPTRAVQYGSKVYIATVADQAFGEGEPTPKNWREESDTWRMRLVVLNASALVMIPEGPVELAG